MRVVCEHCGLPFSLARAEPGRRVYCCSGCALAARVSADAAAGAPPASPLLVAALGAAFLHFNQLLLWLLAVLLAREAPGAGAFIDADTLALLSLALGCALWNVLALAQFFLGARRPVDLGLLALSGGLLLGAAVLGSPALAAAATTLFGGWALRGLAKKKVPRKK